MDRRSILKGCAEFMLSSTMIQSEYFLNEDDSREIVVVVFLRGGMDALNFLAPVDDKNYRAARGATMAVTEKGYALNQTFANNDFRLNTNASGLKELYDNKSLAFVHAAGLTNGTRSHFEAQDLMELGTDSDKNLGNGWLSRYIKTFHTGAIVPAYAIGNTPPASLLGSMEQINITEVKDLKMELNESLMKILSQMYADGTSSVHYSGVSALQNIDHIKKAIKGSVDLASYTPASNANYMKEWPGEDLAKSLKAVAQLIKMEVGIKVATVDYDGWDMHDGQEWKFSKWCESLSRNLTAFYNDIHNYHRKVTVVVMSEFGRRLKPNKNGGTDHGHGGMMMVVGGNVNGGNIYGKWPGLANEQLDNGVDLAVTTDYRTVLAEILQSRKLVTEVSQIFPKFQKPEGLGIVRS